MTTLSGDSLVTLLYHKKLDDEWIAAANLLKALILTLTLTLNLNLVLTLQPNPSQRHLLELRLSWVGRRSRHRKLREMARVRVSVRDKDNVRFRLG